VETLLCAPGSASSGASTGTSTSAGNTRAAAVSGGTGKTCVYRRPTVAIVVSHQQCRPYHRGNIITVSPVKISALFVFLDAFLVNVFFKTFFGFFFLYRVMRQFLFSFLN
jgi:hypothetical protein